MIIGVHFVKEVDKSGILRIESTIFQMQKIVQPGKGKCERRGTADKKLEWKDCGVMQLEHFSSISLRETKVGPIFLSLLLLPPSTP